MLVGAFKSPPYSRCSAGTIEGTMNLQYFNWGKLSALITESSGYHSKCTEKCYVGVFELRVGTVL